MDYIVVQAGGRGSRLGVYTDNKPKAMLPVENLPLIFHLFKQFPDKHFIIIADYKKDVLRKYLTCFSETSWKIVEACGTGTCAGIRDGISLVPSDEPFMLIWSDLLLPRGFQMPEGYTGGEKPKDNYLGISGTFSCRWSWDGQFHEVPSAENGVAGCFWFKSGAELAGVPDNGEFVKWLRNSYFTMKPHQMSGTREYGTYEEVVALPVPKCRPFNRLLIDRNVLTKEAVAPQGERLAEYERKWYKKVLSYDNDFLPRIISFDPLRMEYIQGKNIYEIDAGVEEKRRLLKKIIQKLKTLHGFDSIQCDTHSMEEAYFTKTIDRLTRVRELIPFSERKRIIINGKSCRNIYFHVRELQRKLAELPCDRFPLIHGDCTFSNIMCRESGEPVLIDPRGYFGFTELYGDERYDWAKLYYSVVGNYDAFNLRRFRLEIGGSEGTRGTALPAGEILLKIASIGWEDLEKDFFVFTGVDPYEVRLLHAVIWLSLTTYIWQDYDAVCAAFYNGLYYLEDVL